MQTFQVAKQVINTITWIYVTQCTNCKWGPEEGKMVQ